MFRIAAFAVVFTAALSGQVRVSRFHDRDSWTIDTLDIRVTVLQSGGHVAEIFLKDGGVNPLWLPKEPTMDAEQFDAAKHSASFGGGPAARLRAGLVGHNVCFPFWGDPSEAEFHAGMTYHGETGIARWRRLMKVPGLVIIADLPESHTRMERSIQASGRVVTFDTVAKNLSAWDRAVGWCEHVTIAAPFLEKDVTEMDASITRGRFNGDTSGRMFQWPHGADSPTGATFDLRKVRDIPESGFVNNFLVDPASEYGFLSAFNPKNHVLIGYVFRRSEFPWLNIWEANNEKMLTRGLEFSNTPPHGTAKRLARTPELWDAPGYDWLDAKGELRKTFAAFTTKVPAGYRGVARVNWDRKQHGGRIEVVERETGKSISLDY